MKMLILALPLLLSSGVPASCGSDPPGAQEDQEDQEQRAILTVAELCEDPARYEGQEVKIEGVFQGWRADRCELSDSASPTLTRSDWLIQTGEECVYVTGGASPDFDALNPEHLGRRMELEATVELTEDGKLYLRYVASRPLDE